MFIIISISGLLQIFWSPSESEKGKQHLEVTKWYVKA